MQRMTHATRWIIAVALATAIGCGDDTSSNPGNAGNADTGGTGVTDVAFGDTSKVDTTGTADTASGTDAVTASDTGAEDTATAADTAVAVDTSVAADTAVAEDTAVDPDTTVGEDTTSADTGSVGDDTSSDVSTTVGSCQGLCGKYDSEASCQCDSGCSNFGDCCSDIATVCGCIGDDCCTADADCDDGLACTTEACGKDGKCSITVKDGACAVDGKCYVKGESPTSSVCLICDPTQDAEAFAAKTGTACDDGNACTSADACDKDGQCTGKTTGNCCKADADCTNADACKVGVCNVAAGTCSFNAKPNCCAEGVCCDLAAKEVKPANTSCGATANAVEYQCDGVAVQKRQAFDGCDGTNAAACSKDVKFQAWTPWSTVNTCAAGQLCTLESKDKPPVCKTQGGGKVCAAVKDCDDGNPCTTDTCDGGSCNNAAKASCCVFDSECDDGNACTIDSCTGDNTCSNSAKVCKSPSDCETAVCDAKTGQCAAVAIPGYCKIDGACYPDGAKDATDSCQICTSTESTTAWSLTSTCKCTDGVCCDAKAGKILGQASKCDDGLQATEYQCSEDGKQLQQRQAFRGCTGKSNTCSTSKTNYAWSDWSKLEDCAAGSACEVKDPTIKGACVKVGGGTVCNPNTTCCTGTGTYAAKGTSCSSTVSKTETQCSSPDKGGKVQTRTATAGCTGASTTCSTAASNLVWSAWKDTKTCASDEVCSTTTGTATCTKAAACDPKLTCCTASGTYSALGAKCGTTVLGSQWQCSSDAKGAKVQKRDAFGGCSGKATGCSFDYDNLHFTAWADVKTCAADQYCSVDLDGNPGCVKPPVVACGGTDTWDGEETTAASKKVGAFKDSDPALILQPKPLLGSATDKDYLTYDITDATNTTNPRVHIEWAAPGAVMVCAYYACNKGKNGNECEPVTCPGDSVSFSNSAVSAVAGNGCCLIAQKGVLDFPVSAAGTLDESGKVFFNIKNQSSFCQNVDVKLAFGSNTNTVCDPTKTCCSPAGQWAAKGTSCGTAALKTEYKCAGTKPGDDVQMRQAFAGCTGSSGTCSTTTTNQVWSDWKQATNCTSTQICSVPDPTKPGTCVSGNDLICKATDKYEGPASTSESYDLGSFKDGQASVMMKPGVHLNGVDDKDWFKYRIVDDPNLSDPVVDIEWVAMDNITVCAYYQCTTASDGKTCYDVTCPAGSTAFVNSAVSDASPNGCCITGQSGLLQFSPDAPGLFNTDETGWVFFNVKNAAPICQNAVVKLSFDGSTKACGDGVCESGESTSCPNDCGSCAGKCGAFDSKAACQCDSACAASGDCCWDKALTCGG